jgi:hypothetical protein
MQTKRTPSLITPVAKKAPVTQPRRQNVRSVPLELDAQTLRHVGGGLESDGPKKYW